MMVLGVVWLAFVAAALVLLIVFVARDVRTCVENFKARNKSEGPAILEPIASRKLRRLSTVGSKTRRRPLESSPAAFFFSESRVYCKLINMGGENVTVRERSSY
jgi:hypothetical protein